MGRLSIFLFNMLGVKIIENFNRKCNDFLARGYAFSCLAQIYFFQFFFLNKTVVFTEAIATTHGG